MTKFLTPLAIAGTATASATLVAAKHTPVDATSGAKTMTLPTTAAAGVLLSVEKTDATTNAVTITGTLRGATSSIPLTSQYEVRTFLSEGSGSWRPVSDHRTAASLSATYAPFTSSRFKRIKTRNSAVLRPRIRDISTQVARVKPSITFTNITTSIPNQTNTTITATSPEHNYWGSIAWQVTASGFWAFDPHSTSYQPPWVDEFVTDAPLFAVEVTAGGGTNPLEVLVNGEQVRAPLAVAGGAWMLVDWNGVRAMRRYTLRGIGGMAVKTIRRNAVDSLFAPKSDTNVKAAWLGDSYSQARGLDGYSSIPMMTCDMLGWKVAASAEGGTGYDQPNPATTVASFQARVPDVIAANPDVVILAGGHNIRNATTEQASIVATIQAIQAGLPGVPILVFGAFYGSVPGESGYTTENAAIAAACATTGATYLDTSGWITGTGFGNATFTDAAITSGSTTLTSASGTFGALNIGSGISGTGIPVGTTITAVASATSVTLSAAATATATGVTITVTNTKSNGNADVLIGSDGIHPVPGIGGDYFAARCADAITNSAAI